MKLRTLAMTLFAGALALTACGRRGPLESPSEAAKSATPAAPTPTPEPTPAKAP